MLHDEAWIFLSSDSLLITRERCLELSNWKQSFDVEEICELRLDTVTLFCREL